ncbi:hypothetical protein KUV65_00215 [Maritalea mobilis]|uniref:hypothetical protein n=1 Tax=Maritalea mobilis TaxID=483324 RepID=UPI001C9747E9|nr:hypothetical protein [Maritalea mobilis]MBY6199771.1 hypothetical protein [Maritalea mobilis]
MERKRKTELDAGLAVAALRKGNPGVARQAAETGLSHSPGDKSLLRLLLLAQMSMEDRDAAQDTEARLATDTLDDDTFDVLLAAALSANRVSDARDLIARADREGNVSAPLRAMGRSRIAMHLGDVEAAKAILVSAIEAHPEATALRAMMTETLMASGGAAYARDVLGRLGQPPKNPAPEDAVSTRPSAPPEDTAKGA